MELDYNLGLYFVGYFRKERYNCRCNSKTHSSAKKTAKNGSFIFLVSPVSLLAFPGLFDARALAERDLFKFSVRR